MVVSEYTLEGWWASLLEPPQAVLPATVCGLIGQVGLLGEFAPLRHPAKRHRLKTVLQELMYRSAQFIRRAC